MLLSDRQTDNKGVRKAFPRTMAAPKVSTGGTKRRDCVVIVPPLDVGCVDDRVGFTGACLGHQSTDLHACLQVHAATLPLSRRSTSMMISWYLACCVFVCRRAAVP
jgi:hypothetical protein